MKHWYDFPPDVDLSRNCKNWTEAELADLVGFYEFLGPYSTALMLSRGYKSVCAKHGELKKLGKLELYKEMFLKGDYYEET